MGAVPDRSTGITAGARLVVRSLSHIQVPREDEQSFLWDCCISSPHNLALLPGKRLFPGKGHVFLDFFLPVSALLSISCRLQSQMKAHGAGRTCNSAGTGSSQKAPLIIFKAGHQQLCDAAREAWLWSLGTQTAARSNAW